MNSRADILNRLRGRLGRTAETAASGNEEIATYLSARSRGPQPHTIADPIQIFCEKSEHLSSSIEIVAALRDVPQAIARYLANKELPPHAICWPEYAALDWSATHIAVEARPVRDGDITGITGCFCAIAETGTLMLCSGNSTPAATSLLPETHIAIVPAARIVPVMEDGWQLARTTFGATHWPRAINFISGPSRTGDIEQTIVLGAHGPYRVHVVIVQEYR